MGAENTMPSRPTSIAIRSFVTLVYDSCDLVIRDALLYALRLQSQQLHEDRGSSWRRRNEKIWLAHAPLWRAEQAQKYANLTAVLLVLLLHPVNSSN